MLHARLVQLGASAVVERGLGDDQSAVGMLGDLEAWLLRLWPALLSRWPMPPGAHIDDSPRRAPLPLRATVSTTEEPRGDAADTATALIEGMPRFRASAMATDRACYSDVIMAPVVSNARMTAGDWEQDVRHVVLDVSASAHRCVVHLVTVPLSCPLALHACVHACTLVSC
jgi:hypothetical protein